MGENRNRRAKHGFIDDDSIPSFNLPNDISLHVFVKLPVKSILRCRCVCKQWLCLLSDPEFVTMHLNHSSNPQKLLLRSYFQSFYSVDSEESKGNCKVALRNFPLKSRQYSRILGSCNGLLCIAIDQNMKRKRKVLLPNYKIVLWNPSTRDYKMLPNTNPLIDTDKFVYWNQLIGLGYDSSFEDYKMVRVILRPRYQVDVYSLKTNSWKVIESAPLSRLGFSRDVVGTALNGSIYWLLRDLDGWIVGFDLKDDKFVELQLPPFDRGRHHYCVNLMVIGRCLGVYCLYRNGGNPSVVLWMMKEDKKDEWTKLTAISIDELGTMSLHFMSKQPLCLFENGKVLFYITYFESKIVRVALLVYDPEVNSKVKTIPLHNISNCHDVVMYTESLVSPNAWVS